MPKSQRSSVAPWFLCAWLLLAAIISACGGGGGGTVGLPPTGVTPRPPGPSPSAPAPSPSAPAPSPSAPAPSSSPTSAPTSLPTATALYDGQVLGRDDQFTPIDGDAPLGGLGQPVDGIPCNTLGTKYHHHVHLSIYVNGEQFAVPDVIGMKDPGPEVNGFTIKYTCVYDLHTHDASGLIHVEAQTPDLFNLGQLFDIWGQTLLPTNVAGFSGQVQVYIASAPVPVGPTTATNYVAYTGDLRSIPFVPHNAIVVEVGPPFVLPPYIPAIKFRY